MVPPLSPLLYRKARQWKGFHKRAWARPSPAPQAQGSEGSHHRAGGQGQARTCFCKGQRNFQLLMSWPRSPVGPIYPISGKPIPGLQARNLHWVAPDPHHLCPAIWSPRTGGGEGSPAPDRRQWRHVPPTHIVISLISLLEGYQLTEKRTHRAWGIPWASVLICPQPCISNGPELVCSFVHSSGITMPSSLSITTGSAGPCESTLGMLKGAV